jgi:hypothetical protein
MLPFLPFLPPVAVRWPLGKNRQAPPAHLLFFCFDASFPLLKIFLDFSVLLLYIIYIWGSSYACSGDLVPQTELPEQFFSAY